MAIELCDINNCTGCGICEKVCHQNAITFDYDDLGFRFPIIDAAKCVECKVCLKKCPVISPVEMEHNSSCYLAWAKDDYIHYNCASGGISYILCRHIVENGGFAVGCVWDKDFNAVLTIIDNAEELERIKGSKYVQSYIPSDVYDNIKRRLKNGEHGIFIGLPCQVAAIKSYFNNDSGLVLCDLLCHGGCSPRYHKEHIEYIKKKKRIDVLSDIKYRGGAYDFCISFWNGKKIKYVRPANADTYFYSFCNHTLFRESCYHCSFAKSERVSDITIADFWGVDNAFISDKRHLNGSNLVLIHSLRGGALWDEIGNKIEYYERPFEEAIQGNDTLKAPTNKPKNREYLLERIKTEGFEKAIITDPDYKNKSKVAIRIYIKQRLIYYTPKWIKKYVSKIKDLSK